MSKIFQVYLIQIIFCKKPNKKVYNRAEELYCDAIIFVFWFFIVYLLKKNGNWKMAQGCRLSPICIKIGCMRFGLERKSSNGYVGCKWKPIPSPSMILLLL